MDFEGFEHSLGAKRPPPGIGPLLRALWHEARGDWERAHAIVQREHSPVAAAIHAYLHRKEGDLANADYWYRRAGRERTGGRLVSEWGALVNELLEKGE
jgi:hypothetical protein